MTEPAPLRAEVLFSVVPEWITYHHALTGDDVRLYAVLCRFADGTGRCFPSQTTLAQHARISVRAVRNCVDRLEAVGAVTTRRRWKGPRGTIFYDSGPGREATSSEYVLRVLAQGVPATGAGRYRHQLPPNENQQAQELGRHDVPIPSASPQKDLPSWEIPAPTTTRPWE